MMKLSPGRRVLLLIALVILFLPSIHVSSRNFHIDTTGLRIWSELILLALLALELADRVTMKRDLMSRPKKRSTGSCGQWTHLSASPASTTISPASL
jgi:hypothetical protein